MKVEVDVEVDVLGSSLIVRTDSVDVKQHCKRRT